MAKDKERYEKPELTDYGTIEDVTKGVGTSGSDLVIGAVTPSPEPTDPGSGAIV